MFFGQSGSQNPMAFLALWRTPWRSEPCSQGVLERLLHTYNYVLGCGMNALDLTTHTIHPQVPSH